MGDHSNDGTKYEFKHDTDNFTVFNLLFASICFVTLVVALTLVWFRGASEDQEMQDARESTYEDRERLEAQAAQLMTGLDKAMEETVKEYNQ